jgi:hypothetical protein
VDNAMSEWAKVVTQPLGLVGFGLFLVFGYLARVKRQDERRWLSPVAFAFAAVALFGGLALAYVQIPKPQAPAVRTSNQPQPDRQQVNQVRQVSGAPCSPNVQGVQGDVTVTVDQCTGKTSTPTKKALERTVQESK